MTFAAALALLLGGCGPSENSSSSKTAAPLRTSGVAESSPSNWYIRLVAEDLLRGMKSEDAQLGELEEDDAAQKHTLKALTPFGGSYLDVVFVNPEGVEAGEYKSNFHTSQQASEERWRFTVKTDDSDAQITLSWRGLYALTPYIDEANRQRYNESYSATNPLLKQMKLIDSDTSIEIPAVRDAAAQKYTFAMNGKNKRTFEWVVATDVVDIPVKVASFSAMRTAATERDAVAKAEAREPKPLSFDLSRPPMILEKK